MKKIIISVLALVASQSALAFKPVERECMVVQGSGPVNVVVKYTTQAHEISGHSQAMVLDSNGNVVASGFAFVEHLSSYSRLRFRNHKDLFQATRSFSIDLSNGRGNFYLKDSPQHDQVNLPMQCQTERNSK